MKPARQTSSMPCAAQRRIERRVEALAVGKGLVVDDAGRDPGRLRALRARRRRAGWRATRTISAGKSGRARGLDQRGHVGAAAGDQDGDAAAASSERQARPSVCTRSPPACAIDLADAHRRLAGLAQALRRRPRASSALATTIMPMPQLKVRSISASATPPVRASQPKTGGTAIASRSSAHAEPVRQHARDVVGEAAAGDVGQRLDAVAAFSAASSGFT